MTNSVSEIYRTIENTCISMLLSSLGRHLEPQKHVLRRSCAHNMQLDGSKRRSWKKKTKPTYWMLYHVMYLSLRTIIFLPPILLHVASLYCVCVILLHITYYSLCITYSLPETQIGSFSIDLSIIY